MKRIATIFLLFVTLFSFSQDIDYAGVKVEYTRLPLTPLDKSVKNYQVIILADYLQKIEQQKADYQARLVKAEADYQTALKQYDEVLKQSSLAHQQNLLNWSRLTPQQQAVTPKPEMPLIPPPVKATVVEDIYEKTFNSDLLSSQHIKLEGFNRLPENSLIIQINMSGFENAEPTLATIKKKVKGADGVTSEQPVHVYQFNYRHIFKLKILAPDGKYIMDEAFAPSLNFATHTSKDFLTQGELLNYWVSGKAAEIGAAQEKAVIDNLKLVNELINSNYGFVKMTRSFSVIYVDEKSNYDDLKEAMNHAKNGYLQIGNETTFGQGADLLRKAINIWEAALQQSDVKNKKARIDEDVTEALVMNLAEANAWLADFTKAQEYITKLGNTKISMKEKNFIRATEIFMLDQKKRMESNAGR